MTVTVKCKQGHSVLSSHGQNLHSLACGRRRSGDRTDSQPHVRCGCPGARNRPHTQMTPRATTASNRHAREQRRWRVGEAGPPVVHAVQAGRGRGRGGRRQTRSPRAPARAVASSAVAGGVAAPPTGQPVSVDVRAGGWRGRPSPSPAGRVGPPSCRYSPRVGDSHHAATVAAGPSCHSSRRPVAAAADHQSHRHHHAFGAAEAWNEAREKEKSQRPSRPRTQVKGPSLLSLPGSCHSAMPPRLTCGPQVAQPPSCATPHRCTPLSSSTLLMPLTRQVPRRRFKNGAPPDLLAGMDSASTSRLHAHKHQGELAKHPIEW